MAPDDMIDPEQSNTKLIGTRIIPGLGRRLYGKEGVARGRRRGRRRVRAVVRAGEGGGARGERRLGLGRPTPLGVGNNDIDYCLILTIDYNSYI